MSSTPMFTDEDVSPVLLFATKISQVDGDMTDSAANVSSSMNVNNTEINPEESYLLWHVTAYMSENYLWFILAFGVPGNLASIFTILSMTMVSSSKAHVAILAITDTLAIIVKVCYLILSGHPRVQLTASGCILIMFVQQFSAVYANWVVVAMTTERFLAVCFPLRVGRMYTRRKAFIVLACLAVMTGAVYCIFFWLWTENYEVGYGYWCIIKPTYENFVVGIYWIDGFYGSVFPCLLILIGNILIITNIKRSRKAQRHLTNAFDQGGRKARDQRQITVMLIVVSVVFLILNLPNAFLYFIKPSLTFKEPSYENVQFKFIARFIHLLTDANHAINFYLYFLSMSTFRRRFLDAIQCRRHMKRRPASSMSRTSQTYLHGGHNDTTRLENSNIYSGYKYSSSSSNQAESTYHLKAFGNARPLNDHPSLDKFNGITTVASDV